MPAELAQLEARLRAAYEEAAATVGPEDICAYPAVPAGPLRAARRIRLGAPLTAALAVVLVVAVAVVVPAAFHNGHSPRPGGSPAPAGTKAGEWPEFTLSIPPSNDRVNIRDALTGRLTGHVRLPDRRAGSWNALSAESTGSYVGAEVTPGKPSYVFRITPNANGTKAATQRLATLRDTNVFGASVNPAGTMLGYLDLYMPRDRKSAEYLRIQNLRTNKIVGQWPVPMNYMVTSLSIDSAGDKLAVSAFAYINDVLVQHTYILRPATSGTPIDHLASINNQSGAVALSPDGRTLYEPVEIAGPTPSPIAGTAPATIELAAISTATGRARSVLHTWHRSIEGFAPLLALDPSGRRLLVVSKSVLAAVNLRTGRYTTFRGRLGQPLQTQSPANVNYGLGIILDPIAW